MNGENPLDGSAVHPEAYPVVERILSATGRALREVIGNKPFLSSVSVQDFIDEKFGEMTVRDILRELEKPGRDPRPEFKTAVFREGVETLADVVPGSVLEGVVTNHQLRRFCRYRCPSRRPGAHLGDGGALHQRSARGSEGGRRRKGEGDAGRFGAKAGFPHHALERGSGAADRKRKKRPERRGETTRPKTALREETTFRSRPHDDDGGCFCAVQGAEAVTCSSRVIQSKRTGSDMLEPRGR